MNKIILLTVKDQKFEEFVIREYKAQSIAAMWRHALSQADRLFGIKNWIIKHDTSIPGGYITTHNGDCILIK
jgi:hypothetical protein